MSLCLGSESERIQDRKKVDKLTLYFMLDGLKKRPFQPFRWPCCWTHALICLGNQNDENK